MEAVLAVLREYKASPFLEICALAHLGERELEAILQDMSAKKMIVRKFINGKQDKFNEIITLKSYWW